MVVQCKPAAKDHLPLRTAFSGPKGWSLATGSTAHVSLAGQPLPPSGGLELPSGHLPGRQIMCQLEGVYQGHCHEGLLGFPLVGSSCWCWALLNTLTTCQLPRVVFARGDTWAPQAGQRTAEGLSCWIQV